MTIPVFAAFFLGQGGYAFSLPFAAIAEKARAQGVNVHVYDYTDIYRAETELDLARGITKTALIGYSLGVTSATWLQSRKPYDLVISIAPSTLAGNNNERIDHDNAKRSILYRGTDFLSSAGLHDDYDKVINVTAGFGIPVLSHLRIPAESIVIDGVLAELAKLQKVP
jgi:hypothetical protein